MLTESAAKEALRRAAPSAEVARFVTEATERIRNVTERARKVEWPDSQFDTLCASGARESKFDSNLYSRHVGVEVGIPDLSDTSGQIVQSQVQQSPDIDMSTLEMNVATGSNVASPSLKTGVTQAKSTKTIVIVVSVIILLILVGAGIYAYIRFVRAKRTTVVADVEKSPPLPSAPSSEHNTVSQQDLHIQDGGHASATTNPNSMLPRPVEAPALPAMTRMVTGNQKYIAPRAVHVVERVVDAGQTSNDTVTPYLDDARVDANEYADFMSIQVPVLPTSAPSSAMVVDEPQVAPLVPQSQAPVLDFQTQTGSQSDSVHERGVDKRLPISEYPPHMQMQASRKMREPMAPVQARQLYEDEQGNMQQLGSSLNTQDMYMGNAPTLNPMDGPPMKISY